MQQHSSSNLPSGSQGPNFHLLSTKLIPIGHGVEVDADMWDTLGQVESKDDWALAALMSVFGAQSKFYRARKPRGKDTNLKVFPTQPPVIVVLQHHYRKWLREHPIILDDESAKQKLPEDCEHEDWPTLFEHESAKEKDERRKRMMMFLVKKLAALMANKALNMYRQGRRSSSGYSSSEHDEDERDEDHNSIVDLVGSDSDEEFFNPNDGGQIVKTEPTSGDSSASELSPSTLAFMNRINNNNSP